MPFEGAQRRGDEVVNVDLAGVRLRNVNLTGAKLMETTLVGARISGLLDGLVLNDVEVGPLIEAELDRRHPERLRLRPTDADSVRDAWSVVDGLWTATRARIRTLPEPVLHERVDGEWSFAETVRHLILVTDGWIGGQVQGRSGHIYRFGMPASFVTEPERMGVDVTADPPVAEVLAVREERMGEVRRLVGELTDEELRRRCGDRGEHTVLSCLRTLFDEEWAHNRYANRDLDALTRGSDRPPG